MPCDSIRTVEVSLAKCNPRHMFAALEDLKLSPRLLPGGVIAFGNNEQIDTNTGKSRLTTLRDVNELRQAYSRQIVLSTAKARGWQVKQNPQSLNKFTIIKR
jgi:hypothetical protein